MTPKSKAETLVTVFGGSGFLGRHVVRALAKRQYRVRVAVRRPDLAGHLQPLGRVGQIHAVQANVRHRPSVAAAARGCDVVVNLVGILAAPFVPAVIGEVTAGRIFIVVLSVVLLSIAVAFSKKGSIAEETGAGTTTKAAA